MILEGTSLSPPSAIISVRYKAAPAFSDYSEPLCDSVLCDCLVHSVPWAVYVLLVKGFPVLTELERSSSLPQK
jgi:hypothetical protein